MRTAVNSSDVEYMVLIVHNKRLQLSKALGMALAEVTLRFKSAVHGQGHAEHLRS